MILDDQGFLRSVTPAKVEALKVNQPVIADRLTWLAVHGSICLALRHPDYQGPTRQMMLEFVHQLGRGLVEWECLTAEELAWIERTEAVEGVQ